MTTTVPQTEQVLSKDGVRAGKEEGRQATDYKAREDKL